MCQTSTLKVTKQCGENLQKTYMNEGYTNFMSERLLLGVSSLQTDLEIQGLSANLKIVSHRFFG